MNDFEMISKMLKNSGKADKIEATLKSPEAQKLSKMIDTNSLEAAAKSGDMKALQDFLTQILSTDEGKKLASQISEEFNKK